MLESMAVLFCFFAGVKIFISYVQSRSMVEVCIGVCVASSEGEKHAILEDICSEASKTKCGLCGSVYPAPHTSKQV